jgi:Ser/Thr protein kinase RdoA (MazF antagonist)
MAWMANETVDPGYMAVARDAVKAFPVSVASIVAMGVSENLTYRVTDARGSDFSLRLHRPGYNSLRELESERAWTAALRESGLQVQRALWTLHGDEFVLVDIPALGEQRYAGMTTWLPGELLGDYLENCTDAGERCRLFRNIGSLAARVHNQSRHWQQPPDFERPVLDEDGLLGEQPRWGRFWDHAALTGDEQSLLLATRERLRAALQDYGKDPSRFGLIHADLHPDNLLIDGNQLALIDFDDSAFGWHMYDLASALIEYTTAPDFPELRRALLLGYRDERELALPDEEMLPVFLLLRGMALIGWFHQRPEHAGSVFFSGIKEWVLGFARCYPGSL